MRLAGKRIEINRLEDQMIKLLAKSILLASVFAVLATGSRIFPQLTLSTFDSNELADVSESAPDISEREMSEPALETKSIEERESDSEYKNEIKFWGGFSPDSTSDLPTALTKDARFGIAAVRYAKRFNNGRVVNLKYTADVYLLSVLNYPADGNSRKSQAGFGFSPFGLQIDFRPRKKVQPFIGSSGGIMIYNKKIPNELGTKFNFTAELSTGIEFRIKEDRALTFGYRLFHVSNGGRGFNPAFDNNVIFAGYSFLF